MKNRKHILIVDDVTTNLRFLGEVLKDEYSLSMAKSGKQALKTLEKTTPNLILLDVKMPEMDGYETLTRIKENNKTKNIPVVFLTADNQKENEIKGIQLGASDFIHKPFEPQDLLNRVKGLLEKQDAETELQILADKDTLSEAWNRKFIEKKIKEFADDSIHGSFLLFDFENLKSDISNNSDINEEKLISEISQKLLSMVHKDDIVARIGGLDYAVFFAEITDESNIKERLEKLINYLNSAFKAFVNVDRDCFVKVGVSLMPSNGSSFTELYNNADKALYLANSNNNEYYHFYNPVETLTGTDNDNSSLIGVSQLESLIEEDDNLAGPMFVEYGDFKDIYRFMKRCATRTGEKLQLVLFTLKDLSGHCKPEDFNRSIQLLETAIRSSLRKNDAASKYSDSQFLVILSDINESNRSEVIQRVTECFYITGVNSDIILKVDANDSGIED